MFKHRLVHYAILMSAMALLTLPNLGSYSLWDVDEGVNAEAAREMMESGTWITPHFNFELRTAKPVFLYWLQIASYSAFGVNEFAARLPSVLAGMLTILIVYELARRMFGANTGLLAGLVLASAIEFCMLSHAATPDSTLLLFTVLAFWMFWLGSRNGSRAWFIPFGAATGLAVLTKGPVGLVMPSTAIFFYLLWNRDLKRLLNRRLLFGLLAFFLVAAPWYILVTVETRGVWIKQFIGRENLTRFSQPMENHRGPIFYHVVCILVLFAPWSIFLGATVWNAVREARKKTGASSISRSEMSTLEPLDGRDACRFLICWVLTYLVFFSIAATKLPNYVLPVYPALAILTARFLERWRSGELTVAGWIMPTALASLAFVGVVVGAGLAVAGGLIPLPGVKMRLFPGLEHWMWLGVIPIVGEAAACFYLVRRQRDMLLGSVAITSVVFVAMVAAFPTASFDAYKAPRQLIVKAGVFQPERDIRLLSLQWFQPSLVFYSQRQVERLDSWPQASFYLAMKQPVYMFVPEPVWKTVSEQHPEAAGYRTLARHYDFLKNCDILVVTNQ